MEAIVNRSEFLKALGKVQGIAGGKSPMLILEFVCLSAEKERIKFKATDLEIGIETSSPAKVTKSGMVAAPAKKLFEIFKEIDAEEVKLSSSGKDLKIIGCRSTTKLMTLPAEEFPALPSLEDEMLYTMPDIGNMIDRTLYAASNDAARYNLNGVYLHKTGNGLRMCATDGHRLSVVSVPASIMGMGKGIIIPRKASQEVMKLVDGEFQFAVKDGMGIFKARDTTLYVRMIDGEYPDFNQVIPSEFKMVCTVDRVQLTKALRRVSILASEKSRGVKLTFASKEEIEVSTANPETGEASEVMLAEFSGEPITVGFNGHYLIETLEHMEGEKVMIKFNDEINPVMLTYGDGEHISIVMPMRVL